MRGDLPRFSPAERRHLLSTPRLGPRLVQRLEERGVASLDHLQRSGAERVLRELCGAQSRWSLLNRLSALEQALATWPHAATTPACITGSTGGHRAASAAGRVE